MCEAETDSALVARFQQGDPAAFDALVLRHQAHVRATCLRFLGRRALAEETAQDVFVSVYRNLPRFRGDARFRTWLHRVVINHCRNKHAYRTRRREKEHESLDQQAPGDDRPARQLAAPTPDPDAHIDRQRRLAMMRAAMNDLAEEQRTLLLLRDAEGRSYEEISELLDLNIGTVKSRIFRARKRLTTLVGRRVAAGRRP